MYINIYNIIRKYDLLRIYLVDSKYSHVYNVIKNSFPILISAFHRRTDLMDILPLKGPLLKNTTLKTFIHNWCVCPKVLKLQKSCSFS